MEKEMNQMTEELNQNIDIEMIDETKENQAMKQENDKGVATYISIPDIEKPSKECNYNLLTNYDKINMWTVLIVIVGMMILNKKGIIEKIIERINKIFMKYSFIINALFLILGMTIFLYPKFFNTGISGNISIFNMIEFSLFILLNSSCFMYMLIRKYKEKKSEIKDGKLKFPGIKFLQLSLWIFSLTGLLFLFLTESKIAFIILYILLSMTLSIHYLRIDYKGLNGIKKMKEIILNGELFLIGSLLGIYIIILFSAILIGYNLSIEDDHKKIKKILKESI